MVIIIPNELIGKVKTILGRMSAEAELQSKKLRSLHDKSTRQGTKGGQRVIEVNGAFVPEALAMAQFNADPNYFVFFLLDTYWKLNSLVAENIEDPLIQFSMRPLLEFCYGKILYFHLQNSLKQKSLAIKYWLCMGGLRRITKEDGKEKEMYYHLLGMLPNGSEKNRFINLEKKGFPLGEVSNELQRIFPSVRIKEMKEQLETHLVEVWGNTFDKDYLEMVYLWLSQFMHGNIFLMRVMSDDATTKRHVFKCSLILFLTGYHLLNFTYKEILKESLDNPNLLSIREEIKTVVQELNAARFKVL